MERLLAQLLRPSDGVRCEVIVIDEGSSDRTVEMLAKLEAADLITTIRHDPPVGLPGARNAGLRAASAPYVAWIDDDDLTSPDRLQRQYDALVSTEMRWSCAGRIDIDDELQIIGHYRCPPSEDLMRRLLAFNCLPTAAQGLLVERRLAEEVGGYDTSFDSAEDWEFCIRLLEHSEPHFLDEPLVGYRTGVASMSTNTRRMEAAIRAVLQKHASLRERFGVEPDWAAINRSLLTADLMDSRRAALRRCVKVLRHAPTLRNVAFCGAALVAPNSVARITADRRREQVPNEWTTAARRWLDDLPALPH